jgi:hypothetical protein
MSKQIFSFKMIGIPELQADLLTLATKESEKITRHAATAMSDEAVKDIKARCPVDDGSPYRGFLKAHINRSRAKQMRDGFGAFCVVGPKPNVDFPDANGLYRTKYNKKLRKWVEVGRISVLSVAGFIERGFRHKGKAVPARPFMQPALLAGRQDYMDIAEQVVKTALRNVWR